ncbi:hypothetical protein FRC11_001773, partial [Ceratobasidium sp. 423]
MPPTQCKCVRLITDNGSNSSNSTPSTITGPIALPVPEAQDNMSSQLNQMITQYKATRPITTKLNEAGSKFDRTIKQFCALKDTERHPSQEIAVFNLLVLTLQWHSLLLDTYPSYRSHLQKHPNAGIDIEKLHHCLHPPPITKEESVATESLPEPSKPLYSNVGCSTDTNPTPSAQPLDPSPRPKPGPGPRPPPTPMPKKAHPLTSRPHSHQVRSNVRLVACIAGRPDALTSKTPCWKAVPSDCFSTISKELKTIAPG